MHARTPSAPRSAVDGSGMASGRLDGFRPPPVMYAAHAVHQRQGRRPGSGAGDRAGSAKGVLSTSRKAANVLIVLGLLLLRWRSRRFVSTLAAHRKAQLAGDCATTHRLSERLSALLPSGVAP